MSSRDGASAGPLHEVEELAEQIARVVRPGAGFRVVLHARMQRRSGVATPSMSPSLRLTCVTTVPSGSESRVDRVVVVLARDLDLAVAMSPHRVVRAVVTEAQLERPRAEGEAT